MDFGRSFSYITEDEDWIKKIFIAGGLILTGIGGIVVAGWFSEIIKRVANDEANPLPDWSDFGGYAMEGLKLIGLGLVWSIPAILLGACIGIATVAAGQIDGGETIALVASICVGLLLFIWFIVLFLLMPASIGILATGGSFGDALRQAFPTFRANMGGFLIAAIVGSLAVSILSSVTVILCVIGTVLGSAFGTAIQGHLYGQAFKQAKANMPVLATGA